MPSRTMLIWINRLLWTVLVSAVLLLGAVVSLGRHYIPYVETHRQQLVDAFNRRTGLHLSVAHLAGQWQHLSPHFVIDDLRLYNPQQPDQVILHIKHAEVRLGIFRSIAAGTVAISELHGSGVALQLQETQLGHWQLSGFISEAPLPLDSLRNLIAAIYRAELRDSIIDLQFFSGGNAQLHGGALKLQRAGDFRRLNLSLTFADAGAPLTFVAEMQGDPRSDDFSAQGYASFRNVDLTPMLPAAEAFGFKLQHGRIDGEAWLKRRTNGAVEVEGRVAMPALDVAGLSSHDVAPIKNISAEFVWHNDDNKQQLWWPRLSGDWNDTKLEFHNAVLTISGGTERKLQAALPELQLRSLRDSLLAEKQLPDGLRAPLTTLAPEGALRNIHFEMPLDIAQREQWLLRAQVQQLAVQPWQGAPGIDGGSGYVELSKNGGRVDLASDNFAMTFPHVYHEPLRFDKVRGQILWQIAGEHILVESGPMPVHSDAGSATAQFSLDLPVHHGGTPLMTLMVGLQNSAAQYRDRFIPYTLPQTLLDWLGHSVRGGALPSGGFIYRGSLLANDHLNNTVQLFLDVRDGELKFQPDWPPLRQLRAAVWVDDGDVLVQSPSARMFDRIALQNLNVELHHPDSGSWLTVHGDAQGSGDDVLRVLRESPLRKRVGATLDHWRWSGGAKAAIDLGIPLGGERTQEIAIDAELGTGQLTFGDEHIVLEDVHGPLRYRSDGGLQSTAINAKWYGKPIIAKIATATSGDIDIRAQGHIGMSDLQDWLRQPLFAHAHGETPFDATLHLAGDNSNVEVTTDLQGAVLELPAPYRKEADEILPLHVVMTLGAQRQLLAELGEQADFRLRWDDDHDLDAGVLRLGRSGKNNFVSGQLLITGRVSDTDFGAWRDVLAQNTNTPTAEVSTVNNPAAVNHSPNANTPLPANSNEALAVQLRDLQIANATVGGQTLHNVVTSARRDGAGWNIRVRSDQAAGTVLLSDNAAEPWRMQLDYLRLPAPQKAAENSPTSKASGVVSSVESIDPAKIIAMNVRVNHLWRGDEELGWFDVQLRPLTDGLVLQQLNGEIRGVTIGPRGDTPASLRWTRSNGEHRSEFNGRLVVEDIREPLQRWHYEPVLASKHGRADIKLAWPGRPDEFQFIRADGDAELHVDDGQFLKISSSTSGALKVVGVFNFANFLRRLQLDFSDVFKNGVSFDDMRGSFTMRDGVLTTTDPFEIKSPSSRFGLAGTIDFNTDQTDMELVATLPVASNLPWVAALAGGLPVAAGVYVASKIFENQVDKFASASYAVTGPWTDPQVKLRRVFDDKLPQKGNEAASPTQEQSP